jgi:hypothetical protein
LPSALPIGRWPIVDSSGLGTIQMEAICVSSTMEIVMNLIFGMTVSLMLMAGGVWANVNQSGPLSHIQGAWVSR